MTYEFRKAAHEAVRQAEGRGDSPSATLTFQVGPMRWMGSLNTLKKALYDDRVERRERRKRARDS